jgi:anti-sigma factor RsiW
MSSRSAPRCREAAEAGAVKTNKKNLDMENTEDKSILSAYLDGQLGPEEQQEVESALASDPRLGEELRGLTAVRDLVAGLSREAPVDVASRVLRRVRARGQRARVPLASFWLSRAISMPGALGTAAVAAGILLLISLSSILFLRGEGTPGQDRRQLLSHDAIQRAGSSVATATAGGAGNPHGEQGSTGPGRAAGNAGTLALAATFDLGAPVAATHSSKRHGLQDFRQFLDRPNQRRLFWITADGKAEQQVASVVEQSTRFGFFEISIASGIVIDPRHPAEATIFVGLVNSRELAALADRLRAAVPDRVEGPVAVDPAVMTQLADFSQVQPHGSAPLGDVIIPREDLALRRPGGDPNEVAADAAELETVRDQPTLEQYRSAPVPVSIPVTEAGALTRSTAARPARSSQDGALVGPASRTPLPGHGEADSPPGAPAASRTTPKDARDARKPDRPEQLFVVLVWVAKPRAS